MAVEIKLMVNGAEVARDVEPRLLLVHFLHDTLGLTGAHVGCDTRPTAVLHGSSGRPSGAPPDDHVGGGLPAENPSPSEEEVRHALDGNLCRCTGYHNIGRAVIDAGSVLAATRSEVTA